MRNRNLFLLAAGTSVFCILVVLLTKQALPSHSAGHMPPPLLATAGLLVTVPALVLYFGGRMLGAKVISLIWLAFSSATSGFLIIMFPTDSFALSFKPGSLLWIFFFSLFFGIIAQVCVSVVLRRSGLLVKPSEK